MTLFNLSGFNRTATNVTTYFSFANDITGDLFGAFVAIAIFVVIYVSLSRFENRMALGASVFLTFLFVLLGRAAELFSDLVLFIMIAALAGVGLYLYIKR